MFKGKTTTTERMLYYSGTISTMGEVHHGNTVTDYMDQERERGITITSAAVTFLWKSYKFNLIDTPGHIDFTNEVEQMLGVLDGAIVVLDGSAGVEAQTLTVWRQADRYNIPRIIYVNKMDRKDANFENCVKSIETKLETIPLVTQLPLKSDQSLIGIVDIVTLEKLIFNQSLQTMKIQRLKLSEDDELLFELAKDKRKELIDRISGLDDELANIVIEKNSLDEIPDQNLVESLRRVTVKRKAVPVLLGSSYKNIGVQPLMNAIVLYLPSPDMNPLTKLYSCFRESLSAKAFKVIHDKQRGPVTFLRIFTGQLKKNQKIYNVGKEKTEQGGRLCAAYADDYVEIPEIDQGNIVAVTGLKSAVTGDLISCSASAANRAKVALEKRAHVKAEQIENIFSNNARIPDPVFFCSIEPPSLSYQLALDNALLEIQKEDPSLQVSQNEETGQIVLGGMGELHLEIIKERIRRDYKIDVTLGTLQIAYKETIDKTFRDKFELNQTVGTSKHRVVLDLSLLPNHKRKDILLFDHEKESASNLSKIHPKVLSALNVGVDTALMCGPKVGCPLIDVGIMLHWLEVGRGTSETMVTAAIAQAIRKMINSIGCILLEPIMHLEIVTAEESSSSILGDLGRRRSEIKHINVRGKNKVLYAAVPLSELLGYSTTLRILSSGKGTFTMEFSHYQSMDDNEEQNAVKRITGF
ncbi:ribosome-releasing factor 2, mitochondrial [Leptopilina heterotoma]|uniref:ribosome-releasing factor 2, mitochondrial n=1 Tax=Leptopilina heterotoma TaxID=63436 RepID=UPI001CA8D725|nr:ribosome-releasing factor 2, mitochondrial [Leptopilina heterotoma]